MFKRRTRQGFTLVECLFSLLILALLFEAAILTLQSYQRWIKAAETDHGLEWQNSSWSSRPSSITFKSSK